MESKKSFITYKDMLSEFGQKKIEERYNFIYDSINNFIVRKKYDKNAVIANSVLNQTILDYFTDIKRLKEFHDIQYTNPLKIRAYTSYWILRRKPIQIIKDNEDDVELAFINEKFVASYLLSFLQQSNKDAIILDDDKKIYIGYVNNLEYFLRYRTVTPQMIETMLEAYQAGMAFERASNYIKDYTKM